MIARGLPQLVERLGSVSEVVLLMGESTDPSWAGSLAASLPGLNLRVVLHRDLGYLDRTTMEIGPEAQALVFRELSGKDVLVWAHNLSVGRNLSLLRNLPGWCAAAGARLWLHHHDWWWDGRWDRWADCLALGISSLEEALELSVPTGPHIRHWCVNLADLDWLQRLADGAARWVGNPLPEFVSPDASEIRQAAAWLAHLSGGRRVWLAPVRALRRKNLGEAILLAQYQAEPTCVITTGGPSSVVEVPAWENLCEAAVQHDWPFVPSVLARVEMACGSAGKPGRQNHPPMAPLMMAANAIVMPSLQEGFGLPYLEAAALQKPLLARVPPHATENLAALGCTVTGAYNTLPVPADSFNSAAESTRCLAQWNSLLPSLPRELQRPRDAFPPAKCVDFGTLTLAAQMEVLKAKPSHPFPIPQPEIPNWSNGRRTDHWADRFFLESSPDTGHPAINKDETGLRSPDKSLLPEVIRRFHYWQQHPLLWS